MTYNVAIAGTNVKVLEGTFEIDDAVNMVSTFQCTVRDDTGTNVYKKFQPITVTDPVSGLRYAGYISTVQRNRLSPNTTILSQVQCIDNHAIPMRRTFQGKDYISTYAGAIFADMLSSLAADGITAQYASKRETTQAQLATGTLSNTLSTTNVDDGDLELALAGSTYTKTEITATDFNTGTLTNVAGTSSGLTMTSSSVLKYTGVASPNIGGNLYAYTEFNGTNASIGSNYVFSYDIFIASTSPAIACGVDFICTDGTSFRDSGIRDAYGFLAHPSTVMDGYANDTWYHRDFQLTGFSVDFSGKTIDYVQVGFEGEATGTYTAFIDNVVLKNSSSTVVATFYSGGSPAVNKLLGRQGYNGVTLSNVTAYQSMGQRVSSAYSISSAGIVQDSIISWITPDYSQPLAGNSSNYPSPVVVESSIDGGATWQACTNLAAIPNLQAGVSTSGRTVTLRQTLNLAGPDPTIAPVLTECVFTIYPSYNATKSDISDIDTSSGDFATGTITNVQYSGGEQIAGSYQSWDSGSFANQTQYGTGTGDPNTSISNGQLSLRVDGTYEMRSKFGFAGTWQNFVCEFDATHFGDITSNFNSGLVYRTTGWQDNNNTFAYAIQMENTSLALIRGTNSSSGSGSSTLITRVTVAWEASKTYHFRVVVSGSTHQIYVNDILYVNVTDSTYSAAGYLGVRAFNGTASRNSAFFDNFGVMSSAFSGNRVHSSLSLTSLGSVYGSLIQWNATTPGNTTLLVESSIDGGSTWATCTSGATIPQLTNGTSVSGVSLLIRETLTTQNANSTPTLAGISVFVMGAFSATGTRVSSSLSLANVGRMGSSLVAWNDVLPTNTTLGVDVAIDGGSWVDVTSGNGGTIPGLTAQPVATLDSYTSNTSGNYTSTNRSGGSTATWTYDTPNSRITASGGSSALYVWNSATGVSDFNAFIDMDESDTGGFVWRYTDVNNFYELVVQDGSSSGTQNSVALYKTVAGTRTQLGSNVSNIFTRGTYRRFHVSMLGTSVTVSMDSTQLISTTDAALTSGKTGLRTSGGTARFYQIYVQKLGQDVTSHSVQTRLRLASTDPTVTPQVTDLTLSAFGNTIQAGLLIPKTDYVNKLFSDCFDDLVKQSSTTGGQWWWDIDKNKTAYMLPNAGLPAPWILSSSNILDANLTVTDQSDNYCNRVIVSNVLAAAAINESRIGDGVTRSWSFGYEWASTPTITVNNNVASVGVKGATGSTFYYAVGDNTITMDAGIATYTEATTITFVGTGQYLTDSQYDNTTEQTAVAAIDGTTGIIEYVQDGTGLTKAEGDALAQALCTLNSVRGQMIDGTTLQDGLTPGMLVNVFMPEHSINDGLFLLRSMKSTLTPNPLTGLHQYWYDLELISGPDLKDWTQLYARS